MKKNIVLLFGGRSTEHEVSVVSARAIFRALDREKYNVIPIGIARSGIWLKGNPVQNSLENGTPLPEDGQETFVLPHPQGNGLRELSTTTGAVQLATGDTIDVVFPVLHGRFGEDGTIQGLLEMANVPYVGCGVIGSALGLNKIKQKELAAFHGIPTPAFIGLEKRRWAQAREQCLLELEAHFASKYPLFVKPTNTGSSVGVSKAQDRAELAQAIDEAAEFDTSIIIEQGVPNIREIEVAVLGNDEPLASACGEIVPGSEFYDYHAKYESADSHAIIPAPIPAAVGEQVRELAVKVYSVLCCRGLSRVDFFVTKEGKPQVFFNEVNTLPGFTPISMYPKLWEHAGVSYPELVDRLIDLAVEEWSYKQSVKTSR